MNREEFENLPLEVQIRIMRQFFRGLGKKRKAQIDDYIKTLDFKEFQQMTKKMP